MLPADPVYRRLFAAQVVALLGTGLATVALGLLAYRIVGADAGVVLGTALAVKMVAYVGVAPLAAALAARLPRRGLLVGLDLVRAGIAAALPWVDQVWQVYLLIFVLQSASALFTPTFQATIPDLLPDEADYTKALSLSRLAYDLETLLSPLLAAALLVVLGHGQLFAATAVGFAASAVLVASAALPRGGPVARTRSATAAGMRVYLRTPRLRGLLAVHLAVAAAGAMVFVNTVAHVRAGLGGGETAVAVALAAHGLGSLTAALVLPALLARTTDRAVVLRASWVLAAALLVGVPIAALPPDAGWPAVLALWAVIGAAGALVVTPGGRLLRRSAHPGDLPAVFAADFSLSHACWLLCYPLAGWLAATASTGTALAVLGVLAAAATALAARAWPAHDPAELDHEHPELPPDHGHLAGVARHRHTYRVDDLHPRWPRSDVDAGR